MLCFQLKCDSTKKNATEFPKTLHFTTTPTHKV